MEWYTIVSPIITAILSFVGVYLSNRKQTALMDYRLEQLEKKVGQHNNLETRVVALETRVEAYHSA